MAQLEQGDHSTAYRQRGDSKAGLWHRAPASRAKAGAPQVLFAGASGQSGHTVLLDDAKAALWHGQQRARLEVRGLRPAFADGQIAAIAATQELVPVSPNTIR